MLVLDFSCLRRAPYQFDAYILFQYLSGWCYLCCNFWDLIFLQAYGTLPRHSELPNRQQALDAADWS